MLPRPFLLVLIPGHSSPPPATAGPSTSHFTSSAKALSTVSFNTQLIFASWISLSSGHPWWFLLPRATHFLAPVWLTVERTMWLPGLDYNRFLSLLRELCWATVSRETHPQCKGFTPKSPSVRKWMWEMRPPAWSQYIWKPSWSRSRISGFCRPGQLCEFKLWDTSNQYQTVALLPNSWPLYARLYTDH